MSSDRLVVHEVTVRYGDVTAVDAATLDVDAGSVLALLGPSGCGKSTLLRAIAGLEPLAGGRISWRGSDLADVPVHRRRVGLMFQDHALFPHRNVADNIGFGLRMAGMAAHQRAARVDELLELVDLAGMGQRTVGTLSGGQAQRVALARALAPEPEILLLDEPLAALDRTLRDELAQEIRAVARRLGVTTVHVTHDLDEAMSVADRLVILDEGRVRAHGQVEVLVADPGDVVTARALGLDNVWEAVPGARQVTTPFGQVDLTASPEAGACHLSPTSIAVSEGGPAGEVVACRHRAGRWLLTCRLDSDAIVVVEADRRIDPGESVHLIADLSEAQLLRH